MYFLGGWLLCTFFAGVGVGTFLLVLVVATVPSVATAPSVAIANLIEFWRIALRELAARENSVRFGLMLLPPLTIWFAGTSLDDDDCLRWAFRWLGHSAELVYRLSPTAIRNPTWWFAYPTRGVCKQTLLSVYPLLVFVFDRGASMMGWIALGYALRYSARKCGVDFTERAPWIWNLCGYVYNFNCWMMSFVDVFLSRFFPDLVPYLLICRSMYMITSISVYIYLSLAL